MITDIRQTYHFDATPDAIADALMRAEHIRRWWTTEASVDSGAGCFGWSRDGWEVELAMERDATSHMVTWVCTRSNMRDSNAWEGTTIGFTLTPDDSGQGTQVEFAQVGYRESECRFACEQSWAFFVGKSLKQYVETGRGIPYPEPEALDLSVI
jgi:uncharacterized protein YndB with AHSA1/START domain